MFFSSPAFLLFVYYLWSIASESLIKMGLTRVLCITVFKYLCPLFLSIVSSVCKKDWENQREKKTKKQDKLIWLTRTIMDSELGTNRKSKPLMIQGLCVSLLRDNYKLQFHPEKSISVISLTSMKIRISLVHRAGIIPTYHLHPMAYLKAKLTFKFYSFFLHIFNFMLLCMRTKLKLTLTLVKSSNGVVKRAFTQMFYPSFFCKLLNTFFLTGYRAVIPKGKDQ